MPPEFNKLIDLQRHLLLRTHLLANELRKPASQRDAEKILAVWSEIDHQRPKLNSLGRALRSFDRVACNRADRQAYHAQRERKKERKLLSQRMKIWDRMQELVRLHVEAHPSPLELSRPANDSDPMLGLFYTALHRLANPNAQSEDADGLGCFPDIPLRIQMFESLVLAAYRLLIVQNRDRGSRFIDVGCGGGTKVLAASRYFDRCDGLEYDPGYARAAQRTLEVLDAVSCSVLKGNGLTFEHYADYDVIYFYRPLRDDVLLEELEKHILCNARKGTIILAPYDLYLSPREGFPAACITGPVYVAGMTQREADELHKEATFTSPAIIDRPSSFKFDVGFWEPLLEATRYNVGGSIMPRIA